MRRKPNDDIREAAKAADVKLWEIAEEMSMAHTVFSILLRHELSGTVKARVLKAIKEIETRHKKENAEETTDDI